ncbi:MAG: 30S ribosomal protein S6 [Clostridia bacterium]|jgi:ribosomal protein S6|uniref:30S ribosomal protein S6 n=1 Tax=Candidatus Merdicola sp. TaxID=3085652 RepID=UPI002EAE1CD9|nr:30S ribosomal protein S6 [Clostridia bacterium]
MKYLAMVVLNPNISKRKIDFIQGGIVTLFEQKSKVKKTYFLGRKKLEYPVKNYTEGYHLKFDIECNEKKISQIKDILKSNSNVIFNFIVNNEVEKNTFPILKKVRNPFKTTPIVKYMENNTSSQKIYMLISKNLKLPFAESNILAISEDINRIFEVAVKKLQEYIYVKGFHTIKELKNMRDIENELKKYWKVQFTLGDNINVGQELLIQEKIMI